MNDVIKSINVDGVEYDIQAKELTKVTYAELKELRDNGGLVAGHLYRITDYEFTTKQVETKSAGHVFDIIVLAVAENELSHIARAIAHEGDTYFEGNDLGAWELWYELDNDAEKYAWADAENGKGVIYRMIDEKRNDCPYDFKNALFYNEKLTTSTTSDKYYYTFSYVVKGVLYDGTVEKQVGKRCSGNSMGVRWTPLGKKEMNRNVFSNGGFLSTCGNNTFGNHCYDNTFGGNCFGITFGDYCYNNTFGGNCNNITFGRNCYNNTLWGYCSYNTFGDNCKSNTIGDHYSYNTFGSNITHHKVNSEKTSITLNDEYFDDGSGKLVPIKHPDLSTQPSILPYKFMGQYVYEQLIPISEFDNVPVPNINVSASGLFAVDMPMFLSATAIGFGNGVAKPLEINFPEEHKDGYFLYIPQGIDWERHLYVHVVYTSMPEEAVYYYDSTVDDSDLPVGVYVQLDADTSSSVNLGSVILGNGEVMEWKSPTLRFVPPAYLPKTGFLEMTVYDTSNNNITSELKEVVFESVYNLGATSMNPLIIMNYDAVLFSEIDKPIVVKLRF